MNFSYDARQVSVGSAESSYPELLLLKRAQNHEFPEEIVRFWKVIE